MLFCVWLEVRCGEGGWRNVHWIWSVVNPRPPREFSTLPPSHYLKTKCICKINCDDVTFQKHPSTLNNDEIMMIRNIMQRSNIDVSTEYIRETWHPLYRRNFLKQSLARAYDCRKGYYLYHQGIESEVRHACYFD